MALLSPNAKQQFFNADGTIAAGGKLYTYASGTTTPQATYTDRAGTVPNANPIVLDARGEAVVYLTPAANYRYVLQNAAGVMQWTRDDVIASANDTDAINYTDPLAPAYLKTVSDIINGQEVNLLRFIDRTKHSAIKANTDASDLSASVTSAMTSGAKRIYAPYGTYNMKNVPIGSGIALRGDNKATIFQGYALGNTDTLLYNDTRGSYTNNDISIEAITFAGNNAGQGATQARFTELVSFGRVTNLKLTDVVVRDVHYIGIAVGGCRYVTLTRVQAYSCGWDYSAGTPSSNGGDAIWMGASGTDLNEDVVLRDCISRDNRWAGLSMAGKRMKVLGGHFLRNREAHIFVPRVAGTAETEFVQILGATFRNVTKAYTSSSAVESGAWNFTFAHNLVEDCQHNGLALTDTQNVLVLGNQIYDFGKEVAVNANGVTIMNTAGAGLSPKNIQVKNNRIIDRQATVTGYAAVGIGGAGTQLVTDLAIEGNDMQGWVPRSGKFTNIPSAIHGSGTYARNNAGAGDSGKTVQVYRSTTQSIATGAETAVSFDTAPLNSDAGWVVGSPTRISIPKGWTRVRISAGAQFAANATGQRRARIMKNGTTALASTIVPVNSGTYNTSVSVPSLVVDVVGGTDYLELMVLQDSGGALATTAGAENTWFCVEEVE